VLGLENVYNIKIQYMCEKIRVFKMLEQMMHT